MTNSWTMGEKGPNHAKGEFYAMLSSCEEINCTPTNHKMCML